MLACGDIQSRLRVLDRDFHDLGSRLCLGIDGSRLMQKLNAGLDGFRLIEARIDAGTQSKIEARSQSLEAMLNELQEYDQLQRCRLPLWFRLSMRSKRQ